MVPCGWLGGEGEGDGMSIAVAVKKGGRTVVAADTQENFGDRKVVRTNLRAEKILRVGSSYVAATGWGLYDNILRDYLARARTPRFRSSAEIFKFFVRLWKDMKARYTLVNDQAHTDDPTPFADLDSSFLVVNGSGIYQVSGNMSVTRFEEYYAIGSGASYALGALHVLYGGRLGAEEIAREACQAATAFDVFCGGELDVFNASAAGKRKRPEVRAARSARKRR
jgi:ATP-dependent HslUV protease, peptidase subunit HslV